jgi:hypothetical protein
MGGAMLAMLIAADVRINEAHNGAPVVSRVIPLMDDRPFYFDLLAVFHDLEEVTRS